ncbi:MAG: alpha/beta hydrolase [Ilumatobacteraceae bacterium]
MTSTISLTRPDGSPLILHHLGGSGEEPLFISHATGFHGRCYLEMASHLSSRWSVWAVDYSGHGETPSADDSVTTWECFGEDALTAARHLAPHGGLRAFGHSMGGAAVLLAHLKDPAAFSQLVAFEPIAPPPNDDFDVEHLPIAVGAERRRPTFDSTEAAIANYASKPPLGVFTQRSLSDYVNYGVTSNDDGSVSLSCTPTFEASVFRAAHRNKLWESLPQIDLAVNVIAGVVEEHQPSNFAAGVAERLPNGSYHPDKSMNHFGPFVVPNQVAHTVEDLLSSTSS